MIAETASPLRLAGGLLAVAACASAPHYLGAAVPTPCTDRDVEGCLGWMMERDLLAAELGIYDDDALRHYVQSVVDRLAKGSLAGASPRVVIADTDETYATAGRRIMIARTTMERLDSEAELAGVLAHELAHIEGRHVMVSLFGRPETDSLADRRDAEAIADERAVWLLERAGYTPDAFADALEAVLDADDEEHPPRLERIERVRTLAARRSGFEGRAEYLRRIERMVVGRDPRLGHRVDDSWVVPALGLTLDLDDDDTIRSATDVLVLRRQRATLIAYALGTPWARELAAGLDDQQTRTTALGRVTSGTMPAVTTARDDSPLGKLVRAIRSSLPQPPPGTRVALVERPHGALLIELGGRGTPPLRLRLASEDELADAEPPRIAIEYAPRSGLIRELGVCRSRLLDDPERAVVAGDPIKCADRAVRRAPAEDDDPIERTRLAETRGLALSLLETRHVE